MTSTSAVTRTIATALATALIVLSPGLPFYTAAAAPFTAVAAPVGVATPGAWAGAFSRLAAIQGGRLQQVPALSRIAMVDWNSPLGQRTAVSMGFQLEAAGHTPETFAKLDSAVQETVLTGAVSAPEVAALVAPSSILNQVEARVEANTERVQSIARALGNSAAAPTVSVPAFKTAPHSRIRIAARAYNGAAPEATSAEAKPSKAVRAAQTTAAVAAKAGPVAVTLALAALPFVAMQEQIMQAINMHPAGAIAVIGFMAGARAARDVARHALKRLKVAGPAYGGAMSLAVMAGGAVIGVAAGALGMMSPVVAAVAVSAAVIGGTVMTRIHTPKTEPLIPVNSAGAAETPMLAIAKQGDKHVLILPKAQMGKQYMLSASLVKGLGEKELYSNWLAGEFLFSFKRVGDQVQLVAKNTSYRAPKDSPLQRTFDASIPDATVSAAKVLGEDADKVVILLDELFTEDLLDLKKGITAQFEAPYAQDAANSGLEAVKAFPRNVEITTRLQFNALAASDAPSKLLSTKTLSLTVRYSLSALPDGDYAPRKADDRIGYFSTVFQDWTDGQKRDLTTRYVNRWKLEKVDPSAKVSAVKQPIVYWLENTIPVEYRDAVRRGILEWNKAFEAVGFKDAIVVKQQPEPKAPVAAQTRLQKLVAKTVASFSGKTQTPVQEEEYFDPADARFNVVRWFMNTDDYVLAIAPSRANPYTGQLYNAGIAFHAAFTRPGNVLELSGMADLSKDTETEPGHKHSAKCSHGRELERHASTALAVMEARGEMTPEARKRFVEDFITETVVHEAGHTLGLRHNFAASGWKSLEEMDGEDPYSASVMDYNNVNLAAPGEKQGPFFQTKLGPYDFKAIEYAYKSLDGMNTQEQAQELERIAASLAEEGLAFATDEDVVGIDPMIQRWDMGKDPVEFAKRRIAIVHDLWQRLEKQELGEGKDYQRLTNAYMRAFMQFYTAVGIAVKNIGGIRFHRDHAGNKAGREPFTPISKEEQLKTLDFLKEFVFSDDKLKISPELLRKLAPERQPTLDDPYPALGYVPYHKYVLAIRLAALNHIFNPRVLERIADSEHMAKEGEAVLQPLELFENVTNAIWQELFVQPGPENFRKVKPKAEAEESEEGEEEAKAAKYKYVGPKLAISALRRELQMAHIERLMFAAFGGFGVPEASTMAQQMLVALSQSLKATVQYPWWDFETRAHLQRALLKTVQAMEMGPLMVRRAAMANDEERHSQPRNR